MPSIDCHSPIPFPACQKFELNSENKALIRAIILSKGREGCSMSDIKHELLHQEGINLTHPGGDSELIKMIENIEFVASKIRPSSHGFRVFFYSFHPEQQHLVKLISKQKPSSRVVWEKSPFKKRKYCSSSPPKEEFKKPSTYNSSKTKNAPIFPSPPTITISSSSPNITSVQNNSLRSQMSEATKDDNKSIKNESVSTVMADASKSTLLLDDTIQSNAPNLHGCQLIGDNFFYTMAKNDLGFRVSKSENGYLQCGSCTNGLSIKMAQSKVEQEIEPGKFIIVNIGSTDILNSHQLIELMEDMINFLSTCKKKDVFPILTTLAPLPTFSIGNRKSVLLNFNKFLRINPFGYPVIDLFKLFIDYHGKVDLHSYQPEPRRAHGTSQKILMWNGLGRKRVIKLLVEDMGIHIINVYSTYINNIQNLKWHQNF